LKLYLIGFQRSGTTVLRRLIDMHPDVVCMLHEVRLMTHGKDESDVYARARRAADKHYGKGVLDEIARAHWGTKVPYVNEPHLVMDRCRRWLEMFPSDGRVINIVRDPVDTALSNFKTFQMPHDQFMLAYQDCMKTLAPDLTTLPPECFRHVRFEALVTHPQRTLRSLFLWAGLRPEAADTIVTTAGKEHLRYFDCINSKRAFSWHRKGAEGMKPYLKALKGVARLIDQYAPPEAPNQAYVHSLWLGQRKK